MPPCSGPSQLWNCQPPAAAGSPYGLRTEALPLLCSSRSPPPLPLSQQEKDLQIVYSEERCANPLH
uniref:Uncharacterized protein n=1 Tax=Arundo donax TaxID=35708 RepID=A0A0A9FIF0_ARUDO